MALYECGNCANIEGSEAGSPVACAVCGCISIHRVDPDEAFYRQMVARPNDAVRAALIAAAIVLGVAVAFSTLAEANAAAMSACQLTHSAQVCAYTLRGV